MEKTSIPSIPATILKVILGILFQTLPLLLIAWNFLWVEVWIYAGFCVLLYSFNALWLRNYNLQLFLKRLNSRKSKEEREDVDRRIIRVLGLFYVLLIIIIALDAGRFQWTPKNIIINLIGYFFSTMSFILIHFTMRANPFLSRRIEIQSEEKHEVITQGPYAFVRHPMYLGMSIMYFGISLAMGSLFGMIPALLNCFGLCIRIIYEEKILLLQLPGYNEYTKKMKYRLIPKIW